LITIESFFELAFISIGARKLQRSEGECRVLDEFGCGKYCAIILRGFKLFKRITLQYLRYSQEFCTWFCNFIGIMIPYPEPLSCWGSLHAKGISLEILRASLISDWGHLVSVTIKK
jgi:hypothetical protein